jgi:hypothetical protein
MKILILLWSFKKSFKQRISYNGFVFILAHFHILYFPAYKMHRPIRCTLIFSLEILEKSNDECILILVIDWKKTGLLHTKISNHNIIYS